MCERVNTLGRCLKKLCHLNNGFHHGGVPEENFSTPPVDHCGKKQQYGWLLFLTGTRDGAEESESSEQASVPIPAPLARHSPTPTILCSSCHHYQIIFIEFTHAWDSVFFHCPQIFFLTSLSLFGWCSSG